MEEMKKMSPRGLSFIDCACVIPRALRMPDRDAYKYVDEMVCLSIKMVHQQDNQL